MRFLFIRLRETYGTICLSLFLGYSCQTVVPKQKAGEATKPIDELNKLYQNDLQSCINYLDTLVTKETFEEYLQYYILARNAFKQAEPILSFADKNNYKSLNQANILKVEEDDYTDIKIKKPFGFQVLEETLFEEPLDTLHLRQNAELTKNRLKLVKENGELRWKDHHLIWMLRDAISRIALTGITGFDSPVLENSLKESALVYRRLLDVLSIYREEFASKDLFKQWEAEIETTLTALEADFTDFDRYRFIKGHTNPQLELLVQTQEDWKVEFPFEMVFNDKATSLFSDQTFNIDFFSTAKEPYTYSEEKVVLGKKLFNDPQLSLSQEMSCASCHQEQLAFTDGLKTFSKQRRNTPTLLYASLQKGFFYDSRAGSLEGQIVGVVNNEDEFHSDLKQLTETVASDSTYQAMFKEIYDGEINDLTIRNAIGNYIRSLNPFNSKFDRNMNDHTNDLTANEINGFNLFMGKAKCATCHFPPTFNGTVPPYFAESELESIGVPENLQKPVVVDSDLGRYELYKTKERKHFFKTSTVRNVSLTAPYMHNGVYESLEEVMEFYNNGGGAGLGIELEYQTLPTDSLHLTEKEIANIIAFMNALEDQDS